MADYGSFVDEVDESEDDGIDIESGVGGGVKEQEEGAEENVEGDLEEGEDGAVAEIMPIISHALEAGGTENGNGGDKESGVGKSTGVNGKKESEDDKKKDTKKKKDKKKKDKKPKMQNDLKTAMASERTFFKWVWTAFHIGSIGTFILVFFASSRDPFRLYLVLFSWFIAFVCMFFGLALYYRRRRALVQGLLDPSNWDYAYSPVFVVAAFSLVVGGVVLYAMVRGGKQAAGVGAGRGVS